MLGDRVRSGVPAGQEMLAGVVIKANRPSHPLSPAVIGMILQCLQGEEKRAGIADSLISIHDRVVQLSFELGLSDQLENGNKLLGFRIEKERFLVLA